LAPSAGFAWRPEWLTVAGIDPSQKQPEQNPFWEEAILSTVVSSSKTWLRSCSGLNRSHGRSIRIADSLDKSLGTFSRLALGL